MPRVLTSPLEGESYRCFIRISTTRVLSPGLLHNSITRSTMDDIVFPTEKPEQNRPQLEFIQHPLLPLASSGKPSPQPPDSNPHSPQTPA